MLTFTLAIPCLNTSDLPRFTDLTFQVPMQYCSYSIGCCFYHWSYPQLGVAFALAPSLHSIWSYSPLFSSSTLGTYQTGEFLFRYPIILPFHTVHGVLKASILKWFAIPFSSELQFVRRFFYKIINPQFIPENISFELFPYITI